VSASLGLEVRVSDCRKNCEGGFNPLRGPYAALSARELYITVHMSQNDESVIRNLVGNWARAVPVDRDA